MKENSNITVTISVSLSKEVSVQPIYDEDGDLDIYSSIENITLPGELDGIITYKDGVGTLDPHTISDLSGWNIDDIAAYEN